MINTPTNVTHFRRLQLQEYKKLVHIQHSYMHFLQSVILIILMHVCDVENPHLSLLSLKIQMSATEKMKLSDTHFQSRHVFNAEYKGWNNQRNVI